LNLFIYYLLNAFEVISDGACLNEAKPIGYKWSQPKFGPPHRSFIKQTQSFSGKPSF
jgi:hypothetical protein